MLLLIVCCYVVMLYVTDNKLQLNFQLVTHEREA